MDTKKEEKCTTPPNIGCCHYHRDLLERIKEFFKEVIDERFGGQMMMDDLLFTFVSYWSGDLMPYLDFQNEHRKKKCTAPLIIDCCQRHRDYFEKVKGYYKEDIDKHLEGQLLFTFICFWEGNSDLKILSPFKNGGAKQDCKDSDRCKHVSKPTDIFQNVYVMVKFPMIMLLITKFIKSCQRSSRECSNQVIFYWKLVSHRNVW